MMNDLVKISDIFDVKYGNSLELINLLQCKSTDYNSIPFVSRTEKNNGISSFVEQELDVEPNQGHTLSVAVGGSVLSTFYQPLEYYSGRDMYILSSKKQLSVIEMLYYAKVISLNKYRYNYGRQANRTLKDILIPKDISNKIKNKLSFFYKNTLNYISKEALNCKKIKLSTNDWYSFKLTELFEIRKGERLAIYDRIQSDYNIPLITASSENNGIIESISYLDFQFNKQINENKITIDMFFNVFYHEYKYFSDDNVHTLIPNFKYNKYILLFIVTVLKKHNYKYSFGRQSRIHRIEKEYIKLPIKNNKPDFKYMENYIKSLKYSASIGLVPCKDDS